MTPKLRKPKDSMKKVTLHCYYCGKTLKECKCDLVWKQRKTNREIKFRWFGKEDKKMHYFDLYGCQSSWMQPDQEASDVMQYTGLKDKNGDKEIYEYDIIDKDGLIIGNKYETPNLLKDTTNLLIEGFGEEGWTTTNKKAMDRGCFYSKRYADKDEVQDMEQLHKGGGL